MTYTTVIQAEKTKKLGRSMASLRALPQEQSMEEVHFGFFFGDFFFFFFFGHSLVLFDGGLERPHLESPGKISPKAKTKKLAAALAKEPMSTEPSDHDGYQRRVLLPDGFTALLTDGLNLGVLAVWTMMAIISMFCLGKMAY